MNLVVARQTWRGWWNDDGQAGLRAHPGGIAENLVAHTLTAPDPNAAKKDGRRQDGSRTDRIPIVTHALSSEGADASEDGTGRRPPLVTVRTAGHAGSHGLGVHVHGDAPTLDSTGNVGIALPFDTTQVTSKGNYSNPKPGDPCHPLAAGAHPPAVCFAWQSGGDCRLEPKEEEEGTLHANQTPAVAQGMAVRRLTPTECARLQGFPDGWCCLCQSLEAWADDPEAAAERCRCPDSPQYRAYGNAVTVNVVEWIAARMLALTSPRPGAEGAPR